MKVRVTNMMPEGLKRHAHLLVIVYPPSGRAPAVGFTPDGMPFGSWTLPFDREPNNVEPVGKYRLGDLTWCRAR